MNRSGIEKAPSGSGAPTPTGEHAAAGGAALTGGAWIPTDAELVAVPAFADARPFDFERVAHVDDSPAAVASLRAAIRADAIRALFAEDAFARLGDRLAAVNYPAEAKRQRAAEKRGDRVRALRAAKGR